MKEIKDQIIDKIFDYCQTKVILQLKYLNFAFSNMSFVSCEQVPDWASITGEIRYNSEWVIRNFQDDSCSTMRLILHSLIHSLFCHSAYAKDYKPEYWSVASDIVVEKIILDLNFDLAASKFDNIERDFIKKLETDKVSMVTKCVYYYLIKKYPSIEKLHEVAGLFYRDNHILWYNEQEKSKQQSGSDNEDSGEDSGTSEALSDNEEDKGEDSGTSEALSDNEDSGEGSGTNEALSSNDKEIKKWKNIAEHVKAEIEYERINIGRLAGDKTNDLITNLTIATDTPLDYSSFLRIFGQYHDIMKVNPDEFDYVYYSYSMQVLKNIPIIEQNEYREEKQILHFVIAIDSSGSTEGELVKKFLEMTYTLLKEINGAKKQINVHVIQCDAEIKDIIKITSVVELEHFIKKFRLIGGGGTDFRPVFDYVDSKINDGTFSKVDGLVYFTDGLGKYPEKRPPFKTAFVFVKEYYQEVDTPSWAYKMIIDNYGENLK